jgi:hypothetical protein
MQLTHTLQISLPKSLIAYFEKRLLRQNSFCNLALVTDAINKQAVITIDGIEYQAYSNTMKQRIFCDFNGKIQMLRKASFQPDGTVGIDTQQYENQKLIGHSFAIVDPKNNYDISNRQTGV